MAAGNTAGGHGFSRASEDQKDLGFSPGEIAPPLLSLKSFVRWLTWLLAADFSERLQQFLIIRRLVERIHFRERNPPALVHYEYSPLADSRHRQPLPQDAEPAG